MMAGAATFMACVFIAGVAMCGLLFLFQDNVITLGLQAAGFEAEGDTADVFPEESSAEPAPVIVEPQAPEQFVVSAGSYGQETLPNNAGVQLQVGADDTGSELATITTGEDDILALCQQWSNICSSEGQVESGFDIRNTTVDFKNGGMIVYADVKPEDTSAYQRVGMVMQLDGTTLTVRGIDLNGTLFTTAPPDLQTLVDEAERVANDAIRQLAVSAQGEQYTLQDVIIDENTLTLLLR